MGIYFISNFFVFLFILAVLLFFRSALCDGFICIRLLKQQPVHVFWTVLLP